MKRKSRNVMLILLVICQQYINVPVVFAGSKTECTEISNRILTGCNVIRDLYSVKQAVIRDGLVIDEIDYLQSDSTRQHVFIAEIDLNELAILPSTPNNKKTLPGVGGDRIIPIHAASANKDGEMVWLGVNGDFFDGAGGVMGIFFKEGVEMNRKPAKGHEAALYVSRSGKVGIGTFDEALALGKKLYHALGGLGILVSKGKANLEYPGLGYVGDGVHPRTSVGITKDGKKLYLFVADGRREGYAIGLSLKELAQMMAAVGCYDAINLDGGGSSTMVVRNYVAGEIGFPVINKPTDKQGPRAVSNSLLIVDKKKNN